MLGEQNLVHIFCNITREHLTTPDCWCEPVQIFANELGEVWVHDTESGLVPSGADIAEAIAMLYAFQD